MVTENTKGPAMNLHVARQHYRRLGQPESQPSNDPHALIALVMAELHSALERLVIAGSNQAPLPADAMVRAMSALYILQSSLDMEADPDIAVPLFQVYEFCRQQILAGFRKEAETIDGLKKAHGFVGSLKDAWNQMPR